MGWTTSGRIDEITYFAGTDYISFPLLSPSNRPFCIEYQKLNLLFVLMYYKRLKK